MSDAPKKRRRVKVSYAESLKPMMYGAGDAKEPRADSISLVEHLTVEFITGMTHAALGVNKRSGRVETRDLLFVLRHDAKKVDRATELLRKRKDIERARKRVDDPLADAAAADQ